MIERKLDMSIISINARSSIRIKGTKVVYFDPFKIAEERHDADFIFVTHEHYDHFSPEDCIFRKNRALAPHERSAVPLGTDHCPVG